MVGGYTSGQCVYGLQAARATYTVVGDGAAMLSCVRRDFETLSVEFLVRMLILKPILLLCGDGNVFGFGAGHGFGLEMK
jgi:hypothetical protein